MQAQKIVKLLLRDKADDESREHTETQWCVFVLKIWCFCEKWQKQWIEKLKYEKY